MELLSRVEVDAARVNLYQESVFQSNHDRLLRVLTKDDVLSRERSSALNKSAVGVADGDVGAGLCVHVSIKAKIPLGV